MAIEAARLIVRLGVRDEEIKTKIPRASAALRDFASNARQLGNTLTYGVTLPMAAVAGGALAASVKFESAFAGIKKTVDATAQEFANLRTEILDMSERMPTAATELAKIGEIAGQLGVKKEALSGFVETIAQLGETTNLVGEEGASTLARFMNIMGTAENEVSNVASTIVDLGNASAATEQEIAAMAMRVAGAGVTIGATESDVIALAAALSSVGLQAEAGGTAVSRVLVDMSAAVQRNSQELRVFAAVAGKTTEEFSEAFRRAPVEAFADFTQGLDEIVKSGGDVFAVLESIGLEDIRVRDTLLRSASANDLLRESLDRGARAYRENTALQVEYGKRSETTESQILMLRNEAMRAAIEFGDQLAPTLRDMIPVLKGVAENVQSAIKWFSELDPRIQKTVLTVTALTMALGPTLKALSAMHTAIKAVIATRAAMVAYFTALKVEAAASATNVGLLNTQLLRLRAILPTLGKGGVAAVAIAGAWELHTVYKTMIDAIDEGNRAVNRTMDGTNLTYEQWLSEATKQASSKFMEGGADAARAFIKGFAEQSWGKGGVGRLEEITEEILQQAMRMASPGKDYSQMIPRAGQQAVSEEDRLRKQVESLLAGLGKTKEGMSAVESEAADLRDRLYELERAAKLGAEATESATLKYDIGAGRIDKANRSLALSVVKKLEEAEATERQNEEWDRLLATGSGWNPIAYAADQAMQAAKRYNEEREKAVQDAIGQSLTMIDNYRREIASLNMTTEAERALYEMREGNLKRLPPLFRAILFLQAKALDQARTDERIKELNKEASGMHFLEAAIVQATKAMDDYNKEVEDTKQTRIAEYMKEINLEIMRAAGVTDDVVRNMALMNDAQLFGDQEAIRMLSERFRQMSEFQAQMEGIRDAADALSDAIIDGLRRVGTEGIGGLVRTFEQALVDMAAAWLRSQLAQLLTGWFVGLFNISQPAGNFRPGGRPGSFGGFYADGGIALAGREAWIGEEGPELVRPSRNMHVTPNEESVGGGTVIVNVNVQAMDADSFTQRSAQQVMTRAMRAAAEAARRNNVR